MFLNRKKSRFKEGRDAAPSFAFLRARSLKGLFKAVPVFNAVMLRLCGGRARTRSYEGRQPSPLHPSPARPRASREETSFCDQRNSCMNVGREKRAFYDNVFLRKNPPIFSFILMLCLACLLGCENKAKVDPKFVDAFVELRVVELTYGVDAPAARILRQQTLKKMGFTREQFLAETEKILSDEKMWVEFQKAVVARVDTLMVSRPAPREDEATKVELDRKKKAASMPARKGGVGE